MEHEKKCWPEFFEDFRSGKKCAEVRLNDANYQAGDSLLLREYIPGALDRAFASERGDGAYTGSWVRAQIIHVLGDNWPGIEKGYCVLSTKLVPGNYSGFDAAFTGKHGNSKFD